MSEFDAARQHMIESQIRPNKVRDPALVQAMSRIPREMFVPERLKGVAYIDEDLALGGGRYLMEPMVLARLIQEAEPDATDVVLVVGATTGYSAAILAEICSTVVALENDPALISQASDTLSALDIDSAALVEGPLEAGCPSQGPFRLILFDGAVGEVPETYFDQLDDGGRLVAVIAAPDGGIGRATLFHKADGRVSRRIVFDAAIGRLPGFQKVPGFVF